MPVYIRRGELDIPVPSISSLEEDAEDSYLLDPAMVVDELPQPYRMLDKLLNQLLDDVWQTITDRQIKREEEARIVHPPLIEPSAAVQDLNTKNALCHSDDGRYAFVAFQTGELVAFNAHTINRLGDWFDEEINACFEHLHAAVIGPNIHLLATIDDMGFARLFAFVNEAFYLIQLLNEQPEGGPKSNAKKFDLSQNGDFCSLSLECEEQSWVEVYKLPRDSWLREIESAQKELAKRMQTSEMSLQGNNASESPAPTSVETLLDIKFSPIALVLKVKAPSALTGNQFISQQEAVEKAGLPNTIGNGLGHLFTDENLDLRRSNLKTIYADLQDYDPKIELFNQPTWHYLCSARMQVETVSNVSSLEGIPVSVCIWWKGHYLAQIYQLQSKPSKDVELKPDLVWPMTDVISCSAVSDCSNIVAFGLENGFVSVIDRHLCLPRSMISVGQQISVTKISLLDSTAFNLVIDELIPQIYCLLTLQNGSVVFLDCAKNTCSNVVQFSDQKRREVFVKPLVEYPRVFLYSNADDGKTSVRDVLSGSIICDLAVSGSLEELVKRFDLSADDSILYVGNDDETVQSFNFREIPLLAEYQCLPPKKQCFARKETIEERCQRFLAQRILQQRERAELLESSWDEMNKELAVLNRSKQAQSSMSNPSSTLSKWHRDAYSVTSQRQPLSR